MGTIGSFLDLTDSDYHTIWVTVLGALILALIVYAVRAWHTLQQRLDTQDDALRDAQLDRARHTEQWTRIADELDSQFGGNSNGLRQAIDTLREQSLAGLKAATAQIEGIAVTQQTLVWGQAELKGRFMQHLEDEKKTRRPKNPQAPAP